MIVLAILFAIVTVVGLLMAMGGEDETKTAGKVISGAGAILCILFFFLSTLYVVDPGNVGVEVLFGDVKKFATNGLHWKSPFASIVTFDVRVCKEEWEAEAASKDLQKITVKVAVNYRLDFEQISALYTKIGHDYNEKIVDPAIQEAVKAGTSQYPIEDVIVKRLDLKNLIESRLKDKLKTYYIIVQDVNLVNISFSDGFNKVVEAKQIEEQKIKTAEYKRQQAELDKQSTILEAQAESEKQRLLKNNTSQEVIALKWIEKWSGQLPTYVMGNSIPMVNIGSTIGNK